jgi:hypothetical protein
VRALAYSLVDEVKAVLQIADDDETFDDEIEACIDSADALVNGLLNKAGLAVPEVVPRLVCDACAYFAAWMFRHRRDPEAAEVFWVEAHKFLDVYIAEDEEVAFRVGSA